MPTVDLTHEQLDDVTTIYRDLTSAPSDTYDPKDIATWHGILDACTRAALGREPSRSRVARVRPRRTGVR